ncbi:MAG: AAA family ATPase, partial [Myxococcales bacterium]|nr:AAA family ATPase [Myxococcales bacterium]
MSEALAAIHDHAIVHKDLCLANFVYEPKTGVARLIDFASASELSREQPFVPQLAGLEGTLAYLAPEQSGRINRPIDRRTDLYALGVALYRLATGELPFTSSDPLELIHAHLTRTPRPPHERAPGIGEPLSRIIMTLLAKDPEDRYQSARGLLADLRAFRSDPGQPTLLRTQDRSAVFRVPDRLYGREQERETLLAAMDRVAGGGSEVVVVSGTSGIGKSALVRELESSLVAHRGVFVAGKFDPQHSDQPYEALVTGLRGLLREIIGDGAGRVRTWQQRLDAALVGNGRLLLELIPELEQLLGPQPSLAPLGSEEARNRFHYTMERFVAAFAGSEHPLALFLDDLQWADRPVLELLESLVRSGERSLCLIVSYRD